MSRFLLSAHHVHWSAPVAHTLTRKNTGLPRETVGCTRDRPRSVHRARRCAHSAKVWYLLTTDHPKYCPTNPFLISFWTLGRNDACRLVCAVAAFCTATQKKTPVGLIFNSILGSSVKIYAPDRPSFKSSLKLGMHTPGKNTSNNK